MPSRDNRGGGFALVLAALALGAGGYAAVSWLTGSPVAGGRPLAAVIGLAAIALVVIAGLAIATSRRDARLRARLEGAAPAAAGGDPVAVVESLVGDRVRLESELRALRDALTRLEGALDAELEGGGEPQWSGVEPLGELASRVRTLIGDRREDARTVSELLGLWIQGLELARTRVTEALRAARVSDSGNESGEGGPGTGDGEEPIRSIDSPASLFPYLEAAATELDRLESSARSLRRRLGGDDAAELTEDDFVS